MRTHLLALTAALSLTTTFVSAAPISAVYVFGDSLSDQGNAFILTNTAFPPLPYAQRASNGPVAVEWLAAHLGVPLAPAALGGTNYAVVGAATGPVTVSGSSVVTDNISAVAYGVDALEGTGILNQVGSFLLSGPVTAPDTSLFVVWGGANDLFLNPSAPTAAQAVGNIATAIGALYGAGARQFLVPNLPNLALTPSGLAQPPVVQAGLQQLSLGFNSGLDTALGGLDLLPGIDIARIDLFGLMTAISGTPGAFGITNATEACLTGNLAQGGTVCASPETYLFWDSVHPSARAHMILGDAFATAVVPEPALLTLLLAGVAMRVAGRRRTL
jgi:phospholipase/lecithinase/hemolysin